MAGLLAAAAVAGCHDGERRTVPSPKDPREQAVASVARNAAASPELDAAFAAAFGQKPPAMRQVSRGGETILLSYRPMQLIEAAGRLVLISGGRTDGCHGCTGALAITYLERAPGGAYRPIGNWPEIIEGSSWGEPPDWSRRDDLFAGPAIEARGGGTWQGCTVEQADLIELTPRRPEVRARRILTAYDASGQSERAGGGALEGRIASLEPGSAFVVTYSGALNARVVWRRAGTAYAPTGHYPPLPEC